MGREVLTVLTVDQIRPIRNQVLVRPDPPPTVSAGGIHIPETVNANNPNYYTMTGVVMATGKGAHDGEAFHPINVKPGDRVVFSRYAGKQIEVAGRQRVMILRESELIALSDGEHVQHGYQAAKHSPIINRPGDEHA